MFVGLVNSVRMHCSHRKSTFTAKKKKKKLKMQIVRIQTPPKSFGILNIPKLFLKAIF